MAKKDAKTINQSHFRISAHCDLVGDTSLRSLWIEIPDYCQLQCPYCFANTRRNNPHLAKDNLEIEEYLRLLDDFRSGGGKFLGIPGNGEPFHPGNREMVMQILQHANSVGLRTTVFTTGETLFWEMRAGSTYAENVSVDPDFSLMDDIVDLDVILLIKCNSLITKTQDRLVSQPGYTQAREKAMGWLKEKYKLNSDINNRRLGIVTSIMPENQDEILNLYKYAEDNHLIFDCDTILPQGRGKTFIKPGHALSDQECRALYQALDKISDEHLATGGSYVGVACDRIKHHLYVDIKGSAYTCIGCVERGQELVLGSIRKQSIQEIWDNPIRRQMRDDLDEIMLGPCSYCENFQVSCWSCLGRSIDRFEIKDGTLFLHSRGCFNHRPDWNRWLIQCDRLTRARVSEIPTSIRDEVRRRIHQDGLEVFWQELPEAMGNASPTGLVPVGRKDICFSDLNFPTRVVWNLTTIDEIETDDYLRSLGTLLPRILLCSLKQISERGLTERRDSPFVPSPREEGTIQFTNLKFYLPQKHDYMYRTIVQNSLDPGVLDLEGYRAFSEEQPEQRESLLQRLRIRSRMARLWQRWAEPFNAGESALIIPHIKNLSQQLEDENIETYELILTEDLYRKERRWIDTDIFSNKLNVLTIFPLLDLPMIQERVLTMHDIVRQVVENEQRWKEIYSTIIDHTFVRSWDSKREELTCIQATYRSLAEAGFYPTNPGDLPKAQISDLKFQLQSALAKILVVNLQLFPDSDESSWFEESIPSSLESQDWRNFFAILGGSGRGRNRQMMRLPKFLQLSENANPEVVASRAYNPLLLQLMRLFIDEDGQGGRLRTDWPMAINYFIWLCFFREYLGIQTYFVHHAHNMRRHFDVFLGDQDTYSTPSGIIICTHDRLSSRARSDYRTVFTQVMNPLEELVQAEFLSSDIASSELQREEAHKVAEARKMALGHYGHTLKNRLDVLSSFLDEHGSPAIKMRKEMLRDLTLILQLNALDNREELLERLPSRKQERFLDIENTQGVQTEIDLIQCIREWRQLVGGQREFLIVDHEKRFQKEKKYEAELKINIEVEKAIIGLHLEALTAQGKKRARLKEAIYRELVFELLHNSMRYGAYQARFNPEVCGNYHVSVWVTLSQELVPYNGEQKHLLVLSNEVQPGKAIDPIIVKAQKSEGWYRWPESKKYDGPGMSVDLFRRLELGDMFYRVEEIQGHIIYRVGLHFEGMELVPPLNGKEDAV